mmetsp:Transcript_14356/g.43356  ORF Transcript_14356/g.43356 Transcript_14356/m.43356 type:complete len:597 (+) Transcript_14356:257-2047(+)|eukprot:CAMPEP_0206143186 /NCGR_PEP_ID=MMETSP1473-20131121/19581_1 /ASSEMBLY_ACC=CAM_ASM_001109 /TAXON_ID=1461547 /ORGANISM="Stichococcus sp, Strain RCC1054" /LENGTH=596 /DNA_ID=CAMNT_0053538479 /DNA_START=162 /DNA_END=1952 /DNA_ORIENTATION=-
MGAAHTAWASASAVLSALLYLYVRSSISAGRVSIYETSSLKSYCISWRHTLACSPFGERVLLGDRNCSTVITRDAGYCECVGGVTTKRVTCGLHEPFTCEAACARLQFSRADALPLPSPLVCSSGIPEPETTALAPAVNSARQLQQDDATGQADSLWHAVQQAISIAGPESIKAPGVRTNARDWVLQGESLDSASILAARMQWQAFLAAAPSYPAAAFRGRGIAILSGALPHIISTWVNIKLLRRTGCVLPVELWFLESELPTPGLRRALESMGVAIRLLPAAVAGMSGFAMKGATLLLSGFEEVLFLDSDNVLVRDPSPLFVSAQYEESGAVLWPDYWASSVAPDLVAVLGLPSDAELPAGSFESGQMLFHKRRQWNGLLLAAFMNVHAVLYYELLSNFMGKGDKESFAYALLAVGSSYTAVPTPVGSIGVMKLHCNKQQTHCWQEFAGNTMTQHDLEGRMTFLHTNFKPKWDLRLSDDMRRYTRRWVVLQPGNRTFLDDAFLDLQGRDPEMEAVQALVDMRCAGWFTAYLEARGALPIPALNGFHPINNGMDFRRPYRWGIKGSYLDFTVVTVGDRLKHWKKKVKRSGLRALLS